MNPSDQATRCPACKTVFRVVADQLRVSDGWVRCGRCTDVFNAAENMVDLGGSWARLAEEPEDVPRAPPPQDDWPPQRALSHRARQDGNDADRLAGKIEAAMSRAQHRGETLEPPTAPAPYPATYDAAAAAAPAPPAASGLTFRRPTTAPTFKRSPVDAEAPTSPPWAPEPSDTWPPAVEAQPAMPSETMPAPASNRARAVPSGSAQAPPATTRVDPSPEPSLFDATTIETAWPPTEIAAGLDGLRAEPRPRAPVPASAKPGFMRKAERDQLWRRPHLRALMTGALVGSVLLLAVQVTLAYRDLVAARFPATKPLLESVCAGLGCKVQAARAIESLAVESSGLLRVEKTPQYKLQVTLRNRANLELALPALDVTFTDSRGEVISRKVLLPQDLGSTIDARAGSHGGVVAAGREVTLQGTLQSSAAAPEGVAGYTVELFYP